MNKTFLKLQAFVRERQGGGAKPPPATIPGTASFAYVFGWVLVFLIGVEGVTGAALAAFYSPSTTDAWASVAFVQDRETWGWLVRGIHAHGGSAIAIGSGLHLVQTALYGAYKRPRELTWWLGILLMILILAWAVTGYVLRWDQAGYWANQVEVGIAAGTPVIGGQIRAIALGGNDYGNLTLTRFYMLHVIALPALTIAGIYLHVKLARRHGTTPYRATTMVTPRWPSQTVKDFVAMAAVFAMLVGYTISQGGVELLAPADPSQAFDARPLWYFRWLYELRHLAGSWEKLAAMLAPAVAGGLLFAVPLIDRGDNSRRRRIAIGAVVGLCAAIAALTMSSVIRDANDDGHTAALAKADLAATRARHLAQQYGVPVTGALDVFHTPPMWQARAIYKTLCASCHDPHEIDRVGPEIAPGHGDRAWLKQFIKDPSSKTNYGKTVLGKGEAAMQPIELSPDDLEDVVEAVYAESGASDVDDAKRAHGKKVFEKMCSDCHSLSEGVAGASGPGLGGYYSRDFLVGFIGNPKSAVHMGPDAEMPRFDKDLTIVERDGLASYLLWLRTASKMDVDSLDPL